MKRMASQRYRAPLSIRSINLRFLRAALAVLAWTFGPSRKVLDIALGSGSARQKRIRKVDLASRRASRIVIMLAALVCLPSVAMIVVISRTAAPDLFDLTPKVPFSDGYVILRWPDLERTHHSVHVVDSVFPSGMIRGLGYMMEGNHPVRDGELVQSFVLLPDAGNALHPAHRFGDEMIDVQLLSDKTVRFSGRSLVWVWGTLRALPGEPSGHEPLYVLKDARTAPADKADIPKYFK